MNIGFPISHKENEKRRVLLPNDILRIKSPNNLYFETGYGDVLGLTDEDYLQCGCHVVSRNEVLQQDIICDPKIGDAEYLKALQTGQILFGWIHATQNKNITDIILERRLTAYAWENMYNHGRHIFYKNNELAGESAIIHAFQCYGRLPYGAKVAVIGRGNTARGAIKCLSLFGADITQYDRRTESLLIEELYLYDVVVNCVLWDIQRMDHIICRSNLKNMKRNAMIIDISCDKNGAIETCIPTTFENPTYIIDGILHYAVDHTPSLFYKTFSINCSSLIAPYIEELIDNHCGQVLKDSLIIRDGEIIDHNINVFQKRNTNLP